MPATKLTTSAAAAIRPRHRALWHFAPLERIADTAVFTPVDLADAIFAAPPAPGKSDVDTVPPVPFAERADRDRLMPLRYY